MAHIDLKLTLPRDARYVGVLRRVSESLLTGLDVPQESIDDVVVALSEACGNVIRHADGTSEYGVQLTVNDDHCTIEVCDLGPGFPVEAMEEGAPIEDLGDAEGGRGLPLLKALMDDLEFERTRDTTTVRLIKRWESLGWGSAAADDD